MPNEFVTPEEVSKAFYEAMKKVSGGDIRVEREIIYDIQTQMGGFPSSDKERKKYIETGHI